MRKAACSGVAGPAFSEMFVFKCSRSSRIRGAVAPGSGDAEEVFEEDDLEAGSNLGLPECRQVGGVFVSEMRLDDVPWPQGITDLVVHVAGVGLGFPGDDDLDPGGGLRMVLE